MTDIALHDSLLARRSASAKFLTAPGPDSSALERILFIASRAPDHGRLVPFRFIIIDDAGRGAFEEVLARAARQAEPNLAEAEVDRAREKAHQGPCLVALIGRVDAQHPKITASDQWLSIGCALENLLLAVQGAGFAAAVRSGRYLEMPAMREAFGLSADEHFTCFMAIGTPSEWPPAKPKPDLAKIVSHWAG